MDSDELGTVVLTVAIQEWRGAIDNLEERSAGILRATLQRSTATPWARQGEVSLLLSDDGALRDLNRDYRQRDQSTNVLSFPNLDFNEGKALSSQPPGQVLLGDVVMSFQRLSSEAEERKKPLLDHFAHLLVHGTLHLLGYDHLEDEQALVMENMEENILLDLGMAHPYQDGESALSFRGLS